MRKLVTVEGKAFTGRAGGVIGDHHHFGGDPHIYTEKPVKMIGGKKWVGVDAFKYKKDAEVRAEMMRKSLGYLARVVPDKMWNYIVYIRSRRKR